MLPADGDPRMVVPGLERAAAVASPVGALGLEILTWGETDDPYALVGSLVSPSAVVALDNHMWAEKVLRLQAAMPGARQLLAGAVLRELRMRKSRDEVESLRRAGAAIDRVHNQVPQWLRAGRTEREVGADIADAILAEGHVRVDFVIVGSARTGQPAPRAVRPDDRGRRPGRRRHRRHDARRLLLGLHAHLQRRGATRRSSASTTPSCWPRSCGVRARPARCHVRERRRRRP